MKKILNTAQIRNTDAYTIQHEPIPSIELMERASIAFVRQLEQDFPDKHLPKHIICGNGNNGGDGLAIARLLLQQLHPVTVYIFDSKNPSADNLTNLKRLQKKYRHCIHYIKDCDFTDTLQQDAILVDAIFGSGLNKPIQHGSLYFDVIQKLNEKKFREVVSVDIPSGLFADQHTEGIAVQSGKCYTFQLPKLAFLLPENGKYVPDFTILDIGLHTDFIKKEQSFFFYLEQEDMEPILPARTKFSHKGIYGHALLVAGSHGKMGAAVLAAKACLRSGAGLITAHIPKCGYAIFQSAFPEAMCATDKNSTCISSIPDSKKYDAVAIGPGLGDHPLTQKAFAAFLKKNKAPLIIDADGLNRLSKTKTLLKSLPENTLLTPHPKEFERLAGRWKNDFERLQLQQDFSRKHKVIVVLKGAHTSISDTNGHVYFNSTGNPGMATGGSGDVLTGIIAGLSAQRCPPLHSALLGVYLHGLAGDCALQTQSMESLMASDIIEHLGNAFMILHRDKNA
jgi:hydroxyethylthiazole kinase-like uncharacterized protein yjeF